MAQMKNSVSFAFKLILEEWRREASEERSKVKQVKRTIMWKEVGDARKKTKKGEIQSW